MKRFSLVMVVCALAVGSLFGCGDEDGGSDGSGGMTGAGGVMVATPTFTELNAMIIQPSCATFDVCHDAAAPQAGLDLATDPYNALVNAVSAGVKMPGATLVIPNDPDGSLLMQRLTVESGPETMPPNQPLAAERVAAFRAWIEAGAPND